MTGHAHDHDHVKCCRSAHCRRPRVSTACPRKRGCVLPVLACCFLALLGMACVCNAASIPVGRTNRLAKRQPDEHHPANHTVHDHETHSPSIADHCNELDLGHYDLPLHIGSIFIQLAVSLVGCGLPLALKKWCNTKVPKYAFDLFKHFGSGIILSTGIIHMLPPAHEFLTSPCLSDFWLAYPAFFGLFAMLGLLAAHGMQTGLVSLLYKATARAAASIESSVNNVAVETSEVEHKSESDDLEAPKPSVEIVANPEISNTPPLGHNHGHSMHSSHLQASIYALEFGVAAHSLVIGLALGVSSGEEVVPLVIALAFHQFFEGLALGSTLCDAGFRTSLQPLLFTLSYTLSTPLGIALGILLHSTFLPNSPATLVSIGTIEAVCGGVMIWDALVNLIHANVTNNPAFYRMGVWKRVGVWVAMWGGAGAMAVIGKWA